MILVNLTTEEAAGKIRAWNLVDFICYAPLKHHYFYGPQFILCGIFRRREYTTFGDKCVQMSLATRKLCACVCVCVWQQWVKVGERRRPCAKTHPSDYAREWLFILLKLGNINCTFRLHRWVLWNDRKSSCEMRAVCWVWVWWPAHWSTRIEYTSALMWR